MWAGRIFCFRGGPISCSLSSSYSCQFKNCSYGAVRARVAVMAGLAVLGYFVLGYLIFFLVYTPIDTDHVRGVQGRYFVTALPAGAVFIAALVNCELPRGVPAAIAIAGSIIAGITTVEAVLRPHW